MEKMKVQALLIEDNPGDVVLLGAYLERDTLAGYELTTVERLDEAIAALSARKFDIILLDLGLPDCSGLETFTCIDKVAPETPKIILSGYTDETFALEAVRAGAQDYLMKGPQGWGIAARSIRYALERQRTQDKLRESEEKYQQLLELNRLLEKRVQECISAASASR
jgi:two-component system, cell cycle sensor histidine kinase and response regulator CckA